MHIDEIFEQLWIQYASENPSVKNIHALFKREGEEIVNDHVAFRTFNDPRVNIDVLSKVFTSRGYAEAGSYHFPQKKLFARHFEKEGYPPLPRRHRVWNMRLPPEPREPCGSWSGKERDRRSYRAVSDSSGGIVRRPDKGGT